jgi:hypothetical protein
LQRRNQLRIGKIFPILALLMTGSAAQAANISGPIASTLTITEDSELVGDVTCTVSGAACIVINAPHVTLKLNAFTINGQGDPQTGCGGAATANEVGIVVNKQVAVSIQGPGLVQRFRNTGILLFGSTGVAVTGVTTATNCASGILVAGGGDNQLIRNVSVRNGNGASPCGGI